MAIDPREVNEEGIHIGFTTPPTDQPVTDGRHYEKTTYMRSNDVWLGQVTEGVVPDETGKEDEDDVTEDEIRQRIEDAEKRATEQESVAPDKPKASTRQVKPQNQR